MITRTFFFFFMLFSVCSVLLPVHTVPKWAAVWLCVTQVIPHMHGTSLDRVMDDSPTLSDSVPKTKSVSPNGEFPTVYVAGIAFFSFLQRLFLGAIKNPFSRRADRTRPTQGTGFRCLQIIHRPWLNAGTTMGGGGRGGWSPQISLGQKSMKEPAKKHFTSNYITQVVLNSAHVFNTAIYLQHKRQRPSLPGLQN